MNATTQEQKGQGMSDKAAPMVAGVPEFPPDRDEPESSASEPPTVGDYLADIFCVLEEIRDAIRDVASAIDSRDD